MGDCLGATHRLQPIVLGGTRGPAFRNNYSQRRFVDFRLVTALADSAFSSCASQERKSKIESGGRTGQEVLRDRWNSTTFVPNTRAAILSARGARDTDGSQTDTGGCQA